VKNVDCFIIVTKFNMFHVGIFLDVKIMKGVVLYGLISL